MIRLFDLSGVFGLGAVTLVGLSQVASVAGAANSIDQLILAVVKEGGAWAVVALLIWFYRRDWRRLSDQTQLMMTVAQDATRVGEQTTAALTALTTELRESRQERVRGGG